MMPPMRSALVTGGAGFIGSNLVDALVARGAEVAVVDDLSTGRLENLEGAQAGTATLHRIDICDSDALRAVVAGARPECIFHLAAQIDVRRSVGAPGHDARVNVEGTVNVLDAARRSDVARVVVSSSGGALYGDAGVIPTPEDHRVAPDAPYGMGKWCGEAYAELYARLHGLSTVSLRYANVYGRRQDPLGEGGVVAIFCGRALREEPAIVFGDGLQTRDFVHVDDVVAANLKAAASAATGPINVGSGVETSVLELAALVTEAASADAGHEHRAARLGEVRRSCLDTRRARDELVWAPAVGLRDGLRLTLDSLRDQLGPRAR